MVVNKAIIGAHQYLAIVAFLHLFLSSIVFNTIEARDVRPLLKNFGSSYGSLTHRNNEGKYYFVKVARSGPSPCGAGHACNSFVEVAQSKPSSPNARHDEGYNFIKDVQFKPARYDQGYTLTNVAQFVPSPPRSLGHGQGYTFAKVAQSGPSPRGAGHDQGYTFTTVAQSGPSPRGSGHNDQSYTTLTKVTSSGPSYSHKDRHVQGYTFIEVAQTGPSPRGAGHDGSYISSEVAQSRPSSHHVGHNAEFFQKPT